MTGGIDAYLYSYTTPTGAAIVDADGFPTPSPLEPVSECSTTPGCTHLGQFNRYRKRDYGNSYTGMEGETRTRPMSRLGITAPVPGPGTSRITKILLK
jgi:hypothetical protein